MTMRILGLLATQFLGTTNDNLLRWLVALIGKEYVGPEYASQALSAGVASLVVPYLLLAVFTPRIMYIYYALPLVPAAAVGIALLLMGKRKSDRTWAVP